MNNVMRVTLPLLVAGVSAHYDSNLNPTRYGDPAGGCMKDEKAVQATGLPGSFGAPDCRKDACPTDIPTNVTAAPQCALTGQLGDKKCALICYLHTGC